MREVNHRAKNMLTVVQAISNQTAAKSPKDFLVRFTERLQALSANQDLLVRNEWVAWTSRTWCALSWRRLPISWVLGSRCTPQPALNSVAAQAVGLALHELATNASKYGALSTETGSVEVCWRLDGNIFAMNWTERGGPPVSAPTHRALAARSSTRRPSFKRSSTQQ